jgi:hypothetical protein
MSWRAPHAQEQAAHEMQARAVQDQTRALLEQLQQARAALEQATQALAAREQAAQAREAGEQAQQHAAEQHTAAILTAAGYPLTPGFVFTPTPPPFMASPYFATAVPAPPGCPCPACSSAPPASSAPPSTAGAPELMT